jgi:hypothetical protein
MAKLLLVVEIDDDRELQAILEALGLPPAAGAVHTAAALGNPLPPDDMCYWSEKFRVRLGELAMPIRVTNRLRMASMVLRENSPDPDFPPEIAHREGFAFPDEPLPTFSGWVARVARGELEEGLLSIRGFGPKAYADLRRACERWQERHGAGVTSDVIRRAV